MKRARIAVIAAAVLAVATVAFAQKPDFSGTWTLDPEASGAPPAGTGGWRWWRPARRRRSDDRQADGRHADDRASDGQDGKVTIAYKLDGSESQTSTMGQADRRKRVDAKFDGNKLVITSKSERGEHTQTWSLAGGVLTIEGTSGRGTQKRVYKKSDVNFSSRVVSRQVGSSIVASSLFAVAPPQFLVHLAPSLSNFRSNSPALSPVTGSRRSGATSASGPSTKKRSRKRGCGTCSPGSSTTSSPNNTRSRSSVRGAPANGRSRPNSRSRSPAACRADRAVRAPCLRRSPH